MSETKKVFRTATGYANAPLSEAKQSVEKPQSSIMSRERIDQICANMLWNGKSKEDVDELHAALLEEVGQQLRINSSRNFTPARPILLQADQVRYNADLQLERAESDFEHRVVRQWMDNGEFDEVCTPAKPYLTERA